MSPRLAQEVEFKLRVEGAAVDPVVIAGIARSLGIALREAPAIDQTDTYLDDDSYHLTRSGLGLRVRETRRRRLLCLKVEHGRRRGAFRREELETPLHGSTPSHAGDLPEPFRDRVEPFAPGHDLHPIVVLRTRRQRLRGDGLEVVIDDVRVRDPDDTDVGGFTELEIEVLGDADREPAGRLAASLERELGLDPSGDNKLERALGMRRLGGAPPQPRVTEDLPIGRAAQAILARHFRRMQREEVRVRTTDSADAVHKLRVACRRMRAAVRTFGPWLPDECRPVFKRLLRDTARAFGAVRDFEVLAADVGARLDRLPEHLRKAGKRVARRLKSRSRVARQEARSRLRDPERLARIAQLQAFLDRSDAGAGSPPAGEIAPALIFEAAEAAFAHGRRLGARRAASDTGERPPADPVAALHELRILLKRLRYTAESFVETYGKDLVRFVERTKHLQEILGEFNDAAVAVARLRELVRSDRKLQRRELQAIGGLMTLQQLRATTAQARFDQVWAEFDSPDLRTWLAAVLRSPSTARSR